MSQDAVRSDVEVSIEKLFVWDNGLIKLSISQYIALNMWCPLYSYRDILRSMPCFILLMRCAEVRDEPYLPGVPLPANYEPFRIGSKISFVIMDDPPSHTSVDPRLAIVHNLRRCGAGGVGIGDGRGSCEVLRHPVSQIEIKLTPLASMNMNVGLLHVDGHCLVSVGYTIRICGWTRWRSISWRSTVLTRGRRRRARLAVV